MFNFNFDPMTLMMMVVVDLGSKLTFARAGVNRVPLCWATRQSGPVVVGTMLKLCP